MSDNKVVVLLAVVMVAALVWCTLLVVWSIRCGQAGGAFIAPQSGLPVCVAGIRV